MTNNGGINSNDSGRSYSKWSSLREYAAIKLCVSNSGTDWLDDMIRQSQRDKFAGLAMQAILSDVESSIVIARQAKTHHLTAHAFATKIARDIADSMLVELEENHLKASLKN